ncbi:Putative cytoplasmic protein [Salmonella bongori]|nr:Putative cytoplasmic protein [Salmonella bongori]
MKPVSYLAGDFKLIRHRMLSPEKMGWKYRAAWMQDHAEEIEQLLRHIQDHGPVRSADFTHSPKGHLAAGGNGNRINATWRDYFTAGKVMVVERRNFQRVYDLTRRVMPHWDDERDGLLQPQAESLMLDKSARSLGIFREQWLADYYRLKRPDLTSWRESRVEQQQIIPVEVETLGKLWLHADLFPLLEQAAE